MKWHLLDGGEEEHRNIWTQDEETRLPILGTPSYYKIELESNKGDHNIDGYTKMFASSGEAISKCNLPRSSQNDNDNNDDEMAQ